MIKPLLKSIFSTRTINMMLYDLARLKARTKTRRQAIPTQDRLHLGCGQRKVSGWLNVDVSGSDLDWDLACGRLPWPDNVFSAVVSQHCIEHLEFYGELLPLLAELRRVIRPGGEIWLSCPDMDKVCQDYIGSKGQTLLEDRRSRFPHYTLKGAPPQHIINDLFNQQGEHRNLFDFGLLAWALEQSGFIECTEVEEKNLRERFSEFPERKDDIQSLYVSARVAANGGTTSA
jgi:predicted SAM-dependent methyltransferase